MFSNTTSETGSAGTGVIRLHRLRDYQRLRKYRVRIDGNPAGKIACWARRWTFPCPRASTWSASPSTGSWGTRVVTFQVREGELAEFTCRPAAWWQVWLTSMMWTAFCEVLIFATMNHPLWYWSALLLCGGGVTVLIRHRCIRLDGPRVTSRA